MTSAHELLDRRVQHAGDLEKGLEQPIIARILRSRLLAKRQLLVD